MLVLVVILLLECFFFGYHAGKALNSPVVVKPSQAKKLLLISIDGFRFEYLTRGLTPNLAKLGITLQCVSFFDSCSKIWIYSASRSSVPELYVS